MMRWQQSTSCFSSQFLRLHALGMSSRSKIQFYLDDAHSGRLDIYTYTDVSLRALVQTLINAHPEYLFENKKFTYDGVDLSLDATIADCHIRPGSTLYLVLSRSLVLDPSPRPEQETQGALICLRTPVLPDDPVLRSLEYAVIKSSILNQGNGTYPLDEEAGSELLDRSWKYTIFTTLQVDIMLNNDARLRSDPTGRSLLVSYYMIQTVLNSFERLQSAYFCGAFFSIIMERPSDEAVGIVKVYKKDLLELLRLLESALLAIDEHLKYTHSSSNEVDSDDDDDDFDETLIALIWPPELDVITRLYPTWFPVHFEQSQNISRVLDFFRLTACILDMGLMSYVGSHTSRFDEQLFNEGAEPMRFDCVASPLYFECSLLRLAPLDVVLNQKPVWVFRTGLNTPPLEDKCPLINVPPIEEEPKSLVWFVIATIDAISDIWGSIWAECEAESDPQTPVRVIRYRLNAGLLQRELGVARNHWLPANGVPCQWHGWDEEDFDPQTQIIRDAEDGYLDINDTLLISGDALPDPTLDATPICLLSDDM